MVVSVRSMKNDHIEIRYTERLRKQRYFSQKMIPYEVDII